MGGFVGGKGVYECGQSERLGASVRTGGVMRHPPRRWLAARRITTSSRARSTLSRTRPPSGDTRPSRPSPPERIQEEEEEASFARARRARPRQPPLPHVPASVVSTVRLLVTSDSAFRRTFRLPSVPCISSSPLQAGSFFPPSACVEWTCSRPRLNGRNGKLETTGASEGQMRRQQTSLYGFREAIEMFAVQLRR